MQAIRNPPPGWPATQLAEWRQQPLPIAVLIGATLVVEAVLVAAGGPPSPLTHLFYFTVIFAAVVWGPWVGAAVGALCAVLAEPVALALLGHLDHVAPDAVVRGLAMVIVGLVCGGLARSLLGRISELEQVNLETILAFAQAIDARDPYTARHSEKVAAYGHALAEALGLPERQCRRIYLAGLVHDVGKVALERSLLHKPGALTAEEWAQVHEHPVLSAGIIGRISRFAGLVPGARHHHERFDGRGYPDGLAGYEIPLDARVLAVADAYDAMTSDRSYRAGMSHAEALDRLRAGAGSQFDAACVEAFARLDLGAVPARTLLAAPTPPVAPPVAALT
ncbi:MAG TPA: HD-GYP domain-containing protein [Baekduia sp.]|nr:HD-GYP domain-containing protein [Baekduia sp.]